MGAKVTNVQGTNDRNWKFADPLACGAMEFDSSVAEIGKSSVMSAKEGGRGRKTGSAKHAERLDGRAMSSVLRPLCLA
jgi:hypothetical protein